MVLNRPETETSIGSRAAQPARSAVQMMALRSARGFTLVELLVTIAVIAVLASLLVPALSAAKEKGRGIACLNNLQQLQMAAILYASEHDDWFPLNYGGDVAGRSSEFPSWVAGVLSYGNWQ